MKKLILLLTLLVGFSAHADIAQNTFTLNFVNLESAGTGQRIETAAGSLWVQSLTIQALPGNTGNVFIANSQANAQGTARITLQAGQSVTLRGRTLDNGRRALLKADDVWLDGATTNDQIVWSYVQ